MKQSSQKQVKPSYAQLEQQLRTLQALQISNLKEALRHLTTENAGASRLMASACVVSITDMTGAEIVPPFGIRDGLSADALQALRDDVKRSIALAQL
jgi:hypothetical protein